MALDPLILDGVEYYTSRDSGVHELRGGATARLERGTIYTAAIVLESESDVNDLVVSLNDGPIAVTLPDGTVLASALVNITDYPISGALALLVDITIEELTL